ncbi:uncharacterized protein LOC114371510 [Glycine soja]|uniref:uncharacterized protein LOC114371510 n=1 Tax=Glycine soja TaxID=3848 RepID=UPI00103A1CFE|nr:uncharacterized protein LOC114371510 [Glycine soja]
MSSEPHRALLVKVLNEAHVAQDISVEGFEGIVNNITTNNYRTFTDEEIPFEGRGHNRALHLSVKCMDHIVVKVLINNGSSLNVMPKSTLDKLPFNVSYLWLSSMIVQAFDGSYRNVPFRPALDSRSRGGSFDAPPKVEVCGGRAVDHRFGEEDILVSCPSSTPYVEATEESMEMAFQSFKVVSKASIESLPVQPCSSSAPLMVARVMLGHGYEPQMGLGRNDDGMASLVEFKDNHGRFELGYKPTHANVRRSTLERRGGSMGQQQGPQVKETPLCHINESFVSASRRCEGQVTMIHDEAPQKHLNWVANIVPVPKKDGKVRMCVDYWDLNRASPKDNFPLPHIDVLVDNTTNFALFSFMDGFSGYN